MIGHQSIQAESSTADALAVQIARTLSAQEPAAQARIERALGIALLGGVVETPELGVYLVRSQERADTYYRATSYACGCPDHQRRGLTCKHSYACTIFQMAHAEAVFEAWRHDFEQRRAARQGSVA